MYKKVIMLVATTMASTAWADDAYRVAYSNKEDLGIYADGATESTWCQPHLQLRFQAGPNATEKSLPTLFPKLGTVFQQLCPLAETLSWTYVGSNQQVLLTGQSSKAENWRFQSTQPLASAEASASEVVSADKSSVETLVQDTSPEVAKVDEESRPVVDAVTTEGGVTESQTGLINFAVAGWQPPTEEQRKTLSADFKVLTNQDGCKALALYDFEGQDDYIRLKTKGVTCDSQGFLEGEGVLSLERSDGAVLLSERDVWFKNGLPFTRNVQISGLDKLAYIASPQYGNKLYFFELGSRPDLNSHYFLVSTSRNHQGLQMFDIGNVAYILTDKTEEFKQAESIKKHVEAAKNVVAPVVDGAELSLVFIDKLNNEISLYGSEDKLYTTLFYRKEKWSGNTFRPYGEWLARNYGTENFVFERERRAALEKAQQERRQRLEKAREAREQLSLYDSVKKANLSSPEAVQKYIYRNVRFASFGFNQLFDGERQELSTLVQVEEANDKRSRVVWPYMMELSLPLEKGWYWIKGLQYLDFNQLDKSGLPLTIVEVSKENVYACQQALCADLQDPLVITRQKLGLPEWTVEQAQQLINAAK